MAELHIPGRDIDRSRAWALGIARRIRITESTRVRQFWGQSVSRRSVLPLVIAITAALIAGVLLVPALTAGYGWSERDWNRDGRTSFGEFFEATDIRTRPVTQDARTCVEYFRLKDGLSVRIDCPTSTGARVRPTN